MRNPRLFLSFFVRTLIIAGLLFQQIAIPLEALANAGNNSAQPLASLVRGKNEGLDAYLERVAAAQPELFQQAAMVAIQDAFNGSLPENPGDQALEEQIAHYLNLAASGAPLQPAARPAESSSTIDGDAYEWNSSQTDASGEAGSDWQLSARPGGDTTVFAQNFEALMAGEELPVGLPSDEMLAEAAMAEEIAGEMAAKEAASLGLPPVGQPIEELSVEESLDKEVIDDVLKISPQSSLEKQITPNFMSSLLPVSAPQSSHATPDLAPEASAEVSLAAVQDAPQVEQAKPQAAPQAALAGELPQVALAPQSWQATGGLQELTEAAAVELAAQRSDVGDLQLANPPVERASAQQEFVQIASVQADLGVTLTAPMTAAFGTVITYTVTVTNYGPSAAASVRFTQTLPANGVYTHTVAGCVGSKDDVACSVGALGVNESRTLKLAVQMKGNSVVTSTVVVADSGTVDPGKNAALATAKTTVSSTTRQQFEVGKLVVAANSFVTVTNQVEASGAVEIGFKGTDDVIVFHLKLGANDSVSWQSGGETLEGSGTLYQILKDYKLFEGAFTADGSKPEPLIVPAAGVTPTLKSLGGFALVGSAVITQVTVSSGNAAVSAKIKFSQPGVTTDTQKSLIATIKPGGKVEGTIDKFSMVFSGLKIEVAKATMSGESISVKEAKLTMPDTFGKLTGVIADMKVTANSISFGGAGVKIPIPDIYPVGKPITTTAMITPTGGTTMTTPVSQTVTVTPTIAIVKNSATVGYFDGKYGLQLEGTLQLWLPSNRRNIPIEFKIDDQGQLQANIKEISLTIAGQALVMKKVELSNKGLKVEEASLTIQGAADKSKKPAVAARMSLSQINAAADEKPDKKLTVIVKKVSIDKNGLTIGGAGITNYLPDIKIGTSATFTKLEFTVVVNNPTGNASFELAIKGVLKVHLESNKQEIEFVAKMDKDGKFSGEIAKLTLTIAKSSLELEEIKIDGSGFAAKTATLTLPPVLKGTKATLTGVKIDEKGLSFGDATVAIPIEITLGKPDSNNNFSLKGNLSLVVAQDSTYGFAFEGTLTIKLASQTAQATGSIRLDSAGGVRGSVDSFKLSVAGMELAIQSATIEDGNLVASEAKLAIPKAWGGLSTSVYQVKISENDFSIGGGAFKLPEIKVGDMVLSLEGKLKKEAGGYVIGAGGTLKMPNLGGAGCSGLGVSVEIFASGSQTMAMTIQPMTEVEAEAFSLQLRQISVSLQCTIPIGTSGFDLTSVSGTLTLTGESTKIEIKVTIESKLRVGSFNALTGQGDMGVEYVKNPYKFEIGLGASMKIFSMFEAARARATMRFSDGAVPFLFKAEMNIDAVIAKGEVKLAAWTKDGSFHLTGRIYGQIGVRRGALVNSCWTIPVPYYNSWRDFGFRNSEVCVRIPPDDLFFSATMEFGEFKRDNGTAWGFKGAVEVLGKNYGIYVDSNGSFSVANVDQYKLIDTPSLSRARYVQQVVAAGETNVQAAFTAEDIDLLNSYHFMGEQILIDVTTITRPGDLGITILRSVEDADVVVTLVRPDGLGITGINPPSNVTFREGFVSFDNITDAETGKPILAGEILPTIQTFMNVTNAEFGDWKISLNREPTNEFIINVDGTIYGPPVEKLSIGGQESLDNLVDVTWTQTTETTSTVTIYAAQGAITATASYTETQLVTDSVGILSTQVVTRDLGVVTEFSGLPVAEMSYLAGKQTLNEEIDLSSLRSGTYSLWLEVDDGVNPPNRRYFPGTTTVWQAWEDSWPANVTVQPTLGGLTVAWDENPNADADGYEIEVTALSDNDNEDHFFLDVGESLSQTVTGLSAQQTYSVTVVAYDTGTGRESLSPSVAATPLDAPFTVVAQPAALTVNGGSAASLSLNLASTVNPYPDWVFLDIVSAPEGIEVSLTTDVVTPTIAGVQAGLVVTPDATLPGGVYTVTVSASSSGDVQEVHVPVTVQEPTFTLQANSNALTLFKGDTISVDISAAYQFGESDEIDVDLDLIPPGIDWSFDKFGFAPGDKAVLTLSDTGYLAFGTYDVTIYGTDYEQEKTLTLPLTLAGYEIYSDWDSRAALNGETVEYEVSLVGAAWPDAVNFAFDTASLADRFAVDLPNATVNVPNDAAALVNAEVTVLPNTPAGVYELTLYAVSRGMTETLPLYLTVEENAAATDLQMGYALEEESDAAEGTVIAGETYSYTLAPRNISANVAPDVTVVETTTGAIYLTLLDDDGCSVQALGNETGLTCALGAIAPDSENRDTVITWQVDADAPDGELLVHQSNVSAGATVSESSTLDNIGEVVFDIARLSDIQLLTQADAAIAGLSMTYTATVFNAGPSAADNLVVDFYLPEGVGLQATSPGCVQEAEFVTCAAGNLAVGGSTIVTATVAVAADQGAALEMLIAASSASDDFDFENNYEYVFSEVDAVASLAVTVTPNRLTALEGEIVDYIVTVSNQGPSQATDVDITLLVPDYADIIDTFVADVTRDLNALVIDAGQTLTLTVSALFLEDSGGLPTLIEVEATAAEANLAVASDESVVVNNANPTATLTNTLSVGEGEWGILTVDLDDAGTIYDPLTVGWDLDNDGAFDDGDSAIVLFDARTIDGPAVRPIAVQVTDDEGGMVIVAGSVAILNNAPVVDAGEDQRQPYDAPFTIDFDYVDTFAGDSQSATVDWGDGNVDTVPLPAQSAIQGEVAQISIMAAQVSHTYNKVGEFTANLCVTDDNGGKGCDQIVALAACQEHGLTARFDSIGDEVRITLENASGDVTIPTNLPVTLYGDDKVLETFTVAQEIGVGASVPLSYTWPDGAPDNYTLRLALDDLGDGVKSTQLCSGSTERVIELREPFELMMPLVIDIPYKAPVNPDLFTPAIFLPHLTR